MTATKAMISLAGGLLALGLGSPGAFAISFSLDDNPAAPISGPPGLGYGAEDPYGLTLPTGLAPSPSLGVGPFLDGDILAPGPAYQATPNGAYVDSLSRNHLPSPHNIRLDFSVDRLTLGLPGTAVDAEAMAGQQPGDIFRTSKIFPSPGIFAGGLGAGPGYVGSLLGAGPAGSNSLLIPDVALGLLCGPPCPGPGVVVPPPAPASHDNVDAFDAATFVPPGGAVFTIDAYFTIYPDEALAVGFAAADIFHVPAGGPTGVAPPWAGAAASGLVAMPPPPAGLPLSDSIDALAVWDLATVGGTVDAGIDYALFSLAPGSASLGGPDGIGGTLDDADIFFTDFTGAFALFASDFDLGLLGGDGFPFGPPGTNDNIDALDIAVIPLPPAFILMLAALLPLVRRPG